MKKSEILKILQEVVKDMNQSGDVVVNPIESSRVGYAHHKLLKYSGEFQLF